MTKKISLFVLSALYVFLTLALPARANIDYMVNQSAEYFRTLSRNASIDSADIINYNPAGTVFMKDGIHTNISNQFVPMLNYEIKYDGDTYGSEKPVWLLPNVYVAWKKGNFAIFGSFTVPAGGGSVAYKDGIPMMPLYNSLVKEEGIKSIQAMAVDGILEDPLATGILGLNTTDPVEILHFVEDNIDLNGTTVNWLGGEVNASSMYLAGTAGVATRLFKSMSLSVGIRYMYAKNTYSGYSSYEVDPVAVNDGGGLVGNGVEDAVNAEANVVERVELDATKTAMGFGFIVGFDWQIFDNLRLGARFEEATVLKFTENVKPGKDFAGMFVDGRKSRYDLPMMIGLGVSYDPLSFLTVTGSTNIYFVNLADTANDDYDDVGGYDDDYSVPFDLSLGIEYRPWKFLSVSLGYQFSYTSGSNKTYNDLDFALNSHAIGGGVRYTPWEFLSFTLGGNYVISQPGKDATGVEKFNKYIAAFAFGVEYRYLTDSSGQSTDMDLRRRR